MGIEKAIDILKENKSLIQLGDATHKAIIWALEKQIPKKPKEEKFFDLMRKQNMFRILCSVCGEKYGTIEFEAEREQKYKDCEEAKHCITCGQKFDWRYES